jgi:HSP20 family molecular chaperone IbpA
MLTTPSLITPWIIPRLDPFMDTSSLMSPMGQMRNPFATDPFFTNNPLNTPSALDFFDPFNEVDRLMSRNVNWLTEPDILPTRFFQPLVPQKYRISLDCSGYNEQSIKTEVKDNLLTISGSEGDQSKKGQTDYSVREFKKTYELPDYVDTKRLVSFMTDDGTLVVEFPWKQEFVTNDLAPVVDQANKRVTMNVTVPEGIDPNKLHVTCRDHDLIVRADYRVKNADGSTRSRVHYLRRATLPENTDISGLKCEAENNTLKICAPLGPHHRKRVPIEFKGQQQKSVTEQ